MFICVHVISKNYPPITNWFKSAGRFRVQCIAVCRSIFHKSKALQQYLNMNENLIMTQFSLFWIETSSHCIRLHYHYHQHWKSCVFIHTWHMEQRWRRYAREQHPVITILMKGERTEPIPTVYSYLFPLFYQISFSSDCRKLVTFGILHHLIRCINKYPVCIADSPINRQKFYTGVNHIDEICCKTGLTPTKIQEDLDKDPFVVTICKWFWIAQHIKTDFTYDLVILWLTVIIG